MPLTLLARSLTGTLFSPAWTQQALASSLLDSGSLRSTFVRNVIPAALEEDENELLRRISSNLNAEDWARITELAVPDDWLNEQIGRAVDDLFTWLDSENPVPSVVINSEPVKRRLIGAGTRDIVEILVASWPHCSEAEVAELEEAFRVGSELPFLACQPPEPYRGVLVDFVSEALHREARELPSQIDLTSEWTAEDVAGLLAFKRGARNLRALARWGLLIPFSLLGLMMALAVRSPRDWCRWWGIPSVVAGLATTVLAAIARGQAEAIAAVWTADIAAPRPLIDSLGTLITQLLRQSLARSVAMGIIVLVLGVGLLLLSLFLPDGDGGSPGLDVPASSVGRGERPSGMFG